MTLKMTSAQVVETSVNVNNNSSFHNYPSPDDHTRQTTNTHGFKPFTEETLIVFLTVKTCKMNKRTVHTVFKKFAMLKMLREAFLTSVQNDI